MIGEAALRGWEASDAADAIGDGRVGQWAACNRLSCSARQTRQKFSATTLLKQRQSAASQVTHNPCSLQMLCAVWHRMALTHIGTQQCLPREVPVVEKHGRPLGTSPHSPGLLWSCRQAKRRNDDHVWGIVPLRLLPCSCRRLRGLPEVPLPFKLLLA